MNIITLDWETFYDDEYTLSKLTTEEYVRDPRFEAHGASIRWPDAKTEWYAGAHELGLVLDTIDWSTTALLCHHAQFDGLILSHHYGIVPALYLDTLSMARALLGTHISKSLESLAKEFGLQAKTVPYNLFKGKHWHELSGDVRDAVGRGACHDVELTWGLFCRLSPAFPAEEYALVDATVRMFTVPRLVGDTELLGRIWQEEEQKKRELLAGCEVTEKDIRKDWVFAKLLREHGVEPEQKRMKDGKCKACKGTGENAESMEHPACSECDGTGVDTRYKYAFAKTDDFMRDLEAHEDEDVRLLAEAKLAAHSTGTQTRTMRLGWMSTRGALPVYLNYCGTHIKGWSGGDKVNWQNLRRGSRIAKAIQAPKGCAFVIADASQVECRLLETVAGEEEGIEEFRQGRDPYISLASKFYEEEIYKPKADDPRRFEMEEKRGTGKQLRLSCGYGAGTKTIQITAKRGTYGPPVYLTDDQSLAARDLYRSEKPRVVSLWSEANDVLKKMHAGLEFEWNVVYIKDKRMWMPNGLPIIYETLKWEDDPGDGGDAGWRVRVNKNGWSRMYGAKLVENLIQGLRNVLVRQAWLRCIAAGLDMVSMEHDKLIGIVGVNDAPAAYQLLCDELSRPPLWLPDVPLASEGYISDTFAKPEK
jgi:DNA polymerase family A